MVLLDTGTPGTSREIYSEDADGESRTRNLCTSRMRSQSQLRNDKYIMIFRNARFLPFSLTVYGSR